MPSDNSGHVTIKVVDLDVEVGAGPITDLVPPTDGVPIGSIGYDATNFNDQTNDYSLVYSRESGRLFSVVLGPLGPIALVAASTAGTPTLFGSRLLQTVTVPAAQNWVVLSSGAAPTPPAIPAPTAFVGTVLQVDGIGAPGFYINVTAAFAAAVSGDIIEVLSGVSSLEPATIVFNKSLELRGISEAASIITAFPSFPGPLFFIPPGINNIYFHDFTVRQPNNSGSTTVPINAQTANTVTPNGATGLYFANLTVEHTARGIVIGGNGWVIRSCTFAHLPPAGDGGPHDHILNQNTAGNCFIRDCVFKATTEVFPVQRTRCITVDKIPYGASQTGHSGNLVISGNLQVVGNLNYFFTQNWHKQSALIVDPVINGAYSLWSYDNTHGSTLTGSHFITDTQGNAPLDFYNVLYLSNNTIGFSANARGLVFVESVTGGAGRSKGTPAGGLFEPVANNTVANPVGAPNADITPVANLMSANASGAPFLILPLIPIAAGSSLTPPEVAAIVFPTEGAVVAQTPTSGGPFNAHSPEQVTGQDAVTPSNLLLVRSVATGARLFSGGTEIFGLLQIEATGVNGVAFDNTTRRAKISFVRANATQSALIACSVPDIAGQLIQYQYLQRLQSTKLPEYALAPTGF